MERVVIFGIVKGVIKNELVGSHFEIGGYFLIIYINNPGQFEHKPQFVDCLAIVYFVLFLWSVGEIQGLSQEGLQLHAVVVVARKVQPPLVLLLQPLGQFLRDELVANLY